MHKTGRYAQRVSFRKLPLTVKGLALIFMLCVLVRLVSALGAGSTADKAICSLFSSDGVSCAILNFEIGPAAKAGETIPLLSLIMDPRLFGSGASAAEPAQESMPSPVGQETSASPSGTASPDGVQAAPGSGAEPWLYYQQWNTPVTPSPLPNIITKPAEATSADAIAVTNTTEYVVDTASLLTQPLKITLSKSAPAVLIIHTHGSEAYMPDGEDQYVESDPYRTQDMTQTVMRIGDELTAALEAKGISVIHDKGVYDYPSYQDSYSNSYAAIQSILKKYPGIKVVIDVHRDHIEAKDGSVYKTIAQVNDDTCSQIKFVMGTDFLGLKHPSWKENLKLVLHIQQEMNSLYPSLAKPVEISKYRYNQQATTGSMIVEVGCTGNTLQESLTGIRYFADAVSQVLLELYK